MSEISPFEMGKRFAGLYEWEQVEFFSGIAEYVSKWPLSPVFQWEAMRETMERHPEALKVFKEMSQYGRDE